jgi:hypothetical protein
MTKRTRQRMVRHVVGVLQVMLQLLGMATAIWALFYRESAPTVIMPSVRAEIVVGK